MSTHLYPELARELNRFLSVILIGIGANVYNSHKDRQLTQEIAHGIALGDDKNRQLTKEIAHGIALGDNKNRQLTKEIADQKLRAKYLTACFKESSGHGNENI